MPDASPTLTAQIADLLAQITRVIATADSNSQLLTDTVSRPLASFLAARPDGAMQPPVEGAPTGDIWAVTMAATTLVARLAEPPAELLEATAGLQAAALAAADDAQPARVVELAGLIGDRPPVVHVVPDGPLVVVGAPELSDWLGRTIAAGPVVALCRCGASGSKPLCDGSHVQAGFDGAKDPERIPDRRDTYSGVAVTVLDNRGLCAHSGFCTDRLASVFHTGSEPFVTASGGRLDEILHAVRDCPSGALGAAFADVEVRDVVDQPRPPGIEITKDGPYRLTGGVALADESGAPVPRNAGASLEHYSLCRCGKSKNKPFCSGMHWYANFHDPLPAEHPTLFEWAGGFPALLRVTRLFYEKFVPADPLLSPLFATMAPDHPQRVAAWLGEVFGGPARYTDTANTEGGPYTRMLGRHLGKEITEPLRGRWLQLLVAAADEAQLPADPEFRSAFTSYLEWGSRLAVENSQAQSHPPLHMPMPKWDWGTAGAPGGRVSALGPPPAESVAVDLPAPDVVPSFDQHIKPLFRDTDRRSMQWAFDLWSHAEVTAHGPEILERITNGSMPCDKAWPSAWTDAFRRWLEAGSPA
jgi:CDGSH-type Zn-finger protein/truncated hemoglobin YjbI